MPTKKQIIIIGVLWIVVFGLGYWSGLPEKDSEQRAEADTPPVPTIITNVVTNVLREVVTNTVMVQSKPTSAPVKAQPTPANNVPEFNPVVEAEIRIELKKPTGELTKADLEEVATLNLVGNKLTNVEGLETLTQLTYLNLQNNQLTNVKSLEKLTKLSYLNLSGNQLTEIPKGLEKYTQLTYLVLFDNQLTDVKGLEKLTQLKVLRLDNNPDLTEAQIDQLQKAFPKCRINHNAKK